MNYSRIPVALRMEVLFKHMQENSKKLMRPNTIAKRKEIYQRTRELAEELRKAIKESSDKDANWVGFSSYQEMLEWIDSVSNDTEE